MQSLALHHHVLEALVMQVFSKIRNGTKTEHMKRSKQNASERY